MSASCVRFVPASNLHCAPRSASRPELHLLNTLNLTVHNLKKHSLFHDRSLEPLSTLLFRVSLISTFHSPTSSLRVAIVST